MRRLKMPEQQEPASSEVQKQSFFEQIPTVDQFLKKFYITALERPGLQVRPLTGYLVEDTSRGVFQLYKTLEMNDLLEFSVKAVLAGQYLNAGQNTLPSTIVLVDGDAPVWHTTRVGSPQELAGWCDVPPPVCALATDCLNKCCSGGLHPKCDCV